MFSDPISREKKKTNKTRNRQLLEANDYDISVKLNTTYVSKFHR